MPMPPSQRRERCGGSKGHAGLVGLGAYRSLTLSVMPLPHSVSMQAGEGRGPRARPFPSTELQRNRGLGSQEAAPLGA